MQRKTQAEPAHVAEAKLLPHPSVMEQEAAMVQALEGATAERLETVLAPLGFTLLKLEPFTSPAIQQR